MEPVSSEKILQQLHWRYATKYFDATRKLGSKDWGILAEALTLAPSSYGLQPWKILVVQNPETRKKLRVASWNQGQIEDCSHLVVFTTLKKVTTEYVNKYINKIVEVRGGSADQLKDYAGVMIGDLVTGPRAAIAQSWAQRQAYIAMGVLLETAALIGVDACPMEGLDPSQYDEILGLTGSEYATVAVVALGYRAASDKYQSYKKVRFDAKELIQVVE